MSTPVNPDADPRFAHEHGIPIEVAREITHPAANRVADEYGANTRDPTRTTTLRARYTGEFTRRFRALKGVIREALIENDALGLSANAAPRGNNDFDLEAPRPVEFDFPRDSEKIDAFQGWLDDQIDRGILERSTRDRHGVEDVWQSTYIRQAYSQGVHHADDALVSEGVIDQSQTVENVFNQPKHADNVGVAYTRAYSQLEGISEAMDQQISRHLAEGVSQGRNPRDIARTVNDRVDKIGLSRSKTLARTEVINTYNAAALNRFEDLEADLDGVTVIAEHLTAEDDRVCDECMVLAGRTLSIEDARGQIPVHPNCRCRFVPVRKHN